MPSLRASIIRPGGSCGPGATPAGGIRPALAGNPVSAPASGLACVSAFHAAAAPSYPMNTFDSQGKSAMVKP